MPYRSYRITIPVLVEDATNPRALAVHDKVSLTVEANSHHEAVRRLESFWNDHLPIGFSTIRRLAQYPINIMTRLAWVEPNPHYGERVHRHMEGRFEGVDADRGTFQFAPAIEVDGQLTVGREDELPPVAFFGPPFHIPVEDVDHVACRAWRHEVPLDGIADTQHRLVVQVTGHFVPFSYNQNGVELDVPAEYVRPTRDGVDHPHAPSLGHRER